MHTSHQRLSSDLDADVTPEHVLERAAFPQTFDHPVECRLHFAHLARIVNRHLDGEIAVLHSTESGTYYGQWLGNRSSHQHGRDTADHDGEPGHEFEGSRGWQLLAHGPPQRNGGDEQQGNQRADGPRDEKAAANRKRRVSGDRSESCEHRAQRRFGDEVRQCGERRSEQTQPDESSQPLQAERSRPHVADRQQHADEENRAELLDGELRRQTEHRPRLRCRRCAVLIDPAQRPRQARPMATTKHRRESNREDHDRNQIAQSRPEPCTAVGAKWRPHRVIHRDQRSQRDTHGRQPNDKRAHPARHDRVDDRITRPALLQRHPSSMDLAAGAERETRS